jgi:hypothetical protein
MPGVVGFGFGGEAVAGDGFVGNGPGRIEDGVEDVRGVPTQENECHSLVLGIDGVDPVEPAAGLCGVFREAALNAGRINDTAMSPPS